jgi:hypothetical protein
MAIAAQAQGGINRRVVGGIVGGLAGGVVFGALMGAMGMLPMVAGLVGSPSAVVGFLVHMGAAFGGLFGGRIASLPQGAAWGLGYGVIWWVLGPLVIMPLMMGMGLQLGAALSGPMLMSLVGHLLYGGVAGAVYAWFVGRAS